jgi:hypothetical protein
MRAKYLFFVALLVLSLSSCEGGRYLKAQEVSPSDLSGTYTLLLYGGRYGGDLQNVAILDKDADRYTFEIFAPDFDYKTERGLTAAEAIERAERFVRFHYGYSKTQWKEVLDPSGSVIGYEARPLYRPLEAGYPDILDISYVLMDAKVVVRIRFKAELEHGLFDEERPFIFRQMR